MNGQDSSPKRFTRMRLAFSFLARILDWFKIRVGCDAWPLCQTGCNDLLISRVCLVSGGLACSYGNLHWVPTSFFLFGLCQTFKDSTDFLPTSTGQSRIWEVVSMDITLMKNGMLRSRLLFVWRRLVYLFRTIVMVFIDRAWNPWWWRHLSLRTMLSIVTSFPVSRKRMVLTVFNKTQFSVRIFAANSGLLETITREFTLYLCYFNDFLKR